MSTDRATTGRESVPDCWTAPDDLFFCLVADVLSTTFLWGAATLLASYDPEDAPVPVTAAQRSRPSASLPSQRSLTA